MLTTVPQVATQPISRPRRFSPRAESLQPGGSLMHPRGHRENPRGRNRPVFRGSLGEDGGEFHGHCPLSHTGTHYP